MKTILASLLALTVLSGGASARTVFDDLRETAPRSGVFADIQSTAPRSVFDGLSDTAPRSSFDTIRDSAPRTDGVFGDLQTGAP